MADENLDTFTTFGELLKYLRRRARLTQRELGIAVGYSDAQIARLEAGQRQPDPAAVRARFLEALDCKPGSAEARRLVELAGAAQSDQAEIEPHHRTPNNLPAQVTSFIGRAGELAELSEMLQTARLLTLTGSGGIGKTRLALELAAQVLDRFKDGVWLIELAPLTDPERVPQAVAAVLGLHDQTGRDIQETVLDYLSAKDCLLILDNCEHLIGACARFADALLHAAPGVRVIASSREALGIGGELAWRVPSLAVPEPGEQVDAGELGKYAGVQLFVERTAYVEPGFALEQQNADAVRQICYRLDGIPLAIELAAARMRALPAETIAQRLSDRFRLLTGGSRTALPRQQTLRATIDWSHALLHEAERVLLRRLSVFLGGFTLEAAEAVAADGDAGQSAGINPADVLDLLTALVDKSLVQYGAGRYWLLETIRQYAREKLIENEVDAGRSVRDRHLAYFAHFGESLQLVLDGMVAGDQVMAMKRVDLEADNCRQALEWAMETSQVESFWRLNEGLLWWWYARPLQLEHMDRLNRFLRLPALAEADPYRARVYCWLAVFHQRRSELAASSGYAEKALAIGLTLGDKQIQRIAYSILTLNQIYQGQYAQARVYIAARDAILRELLPASDLPEVTHQAYGTLALHEGDYVQACALLASVHAIAIAKGHRLWSSALARLLGYAQTYAGDLQAAGQRFRESLIDNSALLDRQAVAACLAAFGGLALAQGDLERSAQLFGASDGLSEAIHTRILPDDRMPYNRNVAELRTRMDAAELDAASARGRAMTYDEAIDYALAGA